MEAQTGMNSLDLRERLFAGSMPVPFSGCWIWIGYADKHGYGRISVKGKPRPTHRVSYAAFKGLMPQSASVCHSCDTPECVNPDHLFLGTHSDNMRDREQKGRANKAVGANNGNARLTQSAVLDIRKMRNQGASMKQIAVRFGLSGTGHVSNIVNRKIWNHV